MKPDESSVLINLLTYPTKSSISYIKLVKKYIENIGEVRRSKFQIRDEDEYYFVPYLYHMFGKFDLAFILLIDNIAISNKTFYPLDFVNDDPNSLDTFKSQIISGITLSFDNQPIKKRFPVFNTEKFIGITNIKINNGLLLGCGYILLDYIYERIQDISTEHSNINFIVIESFGTYELTLLTSANSINYIAKFIESIREMSLNEDNEKVRKIRNNYLYGLEYFEENSDLEYHLFSDTQSYYGARITEDWKLDKIQNQPEVNLSYEFLVKPGHFHNLSNHLQRLNEGSAIDLNTTYMLPGKFDYSVNLKDGLNFSFSELVFDMMREDYSENEDHLNQHIRGVETKIKIKRELVMGGQAETANIKNKSSNQYLSTKAYKRSQIKIIKEDLKCIKISKTLRQRLVKLFVSYNNLLQNPVLFNLAIDFRFFVEDLRIIIENYSNNIRYFYSSDPVTTENWEIDGNYSVFDIEYKLNLYLEIFEHAFYLRYVNNYTLEEANDFQISYNIQLQQIITALDNYYKILGLTITNNSKEPNKPINYRNKVALTYFQGKETLTNEIGVCFSLHNLYEPSSLIALFSKEIFSILIKSSVYDDSIFEIKSEASKFWKSYRRNYPAQEVLSYFEIFDKFNYSYILIDLLRLYYLFNKNYKLFYYYQWYLLLQLSSLYDINGNFNRSILYRELYRILLVAGLFDYLNEDSDKSYTKHAKESLPTSEISDQWNYFSQISHTPLSELAITYLGPIFKKILTDRKLNLSRYTENSSLLNQDAINEMQAEIKNIKSIDKISDSIFIKSINRELSNILESSSAIKPEAIEFILTENLRLVSYSFMFYIGDTNKYNVSTLKRSWHTGTIEYIPNVIELFIIDPQGGVFFHDQKKLLDYSIVRSSIFCYLKHISMIYKKYMLQYDISK